jgi:hypothetical protein
VGSVGELHTQVAPESVMMLALTEMMYAMAVPFSLIRRVDQGNKTRLTGPRRQTSADLSLTDGASVIVLKTSGKTRTHRKTRASTLSGMSTSIEPKVIAKGRIGNLCEKKMEHCNY